MSCTCFRGDRRQIMVSLPPTAAPSLGQPGSPCPIPPQAQPTRGGAGQRGDRTALDFRAVQSGKQVPLPLLREEKLRLALLFSLPPTLASPVYPTFLFSQNESCSIVSDSL